MTTTSPVMLIQLELERRRRAGALRMPAFRGAALAVQSLTAKEWIMSGPSETGKTFATLYRLHTLLTTHPGARATRLRKVRASLYGTALDTWERVIQYGTMQPKAYGGTKSSLYVYPNGSRVYVGGLDNAAKILSGERDYIYVNQAEELTADDWETLTTRTTGRGAVTPHPMLFGDCNPDDPEHWILSRTNSGALTMLTSRHEDNPTLHDGAEWTVQGRRTLDTLDALTGPRYSRLRMGEWVYDDGPEAFLPSIAMWDGCITDVTPLDGRQPMVIALDAAINGDTFALIGVSRNPRDDTGLLVRYEQVWVPNGDSSIDFTQIELVLRDLIERYNVIQVAYDPYQLHYLAQRLTDVVWCDPFNQNAMRLESDAQLRTLIIQRGIGHDGSMTTLREHLLNADAKIDDTGHKLRIVKRQSHLKIDAAVALSMAAYRALELNLY